LIFLFGHAKVQQYRGSRINTDEISNKSIWPNAGGLDTSMVLGIPLGRLFDVVNRTSETPARHGRPLNGRVGDLNVRTVVADSARMRERSRAAIGTKVLRGLVHILDYLDWTGVAACRRPVGQTKPFGL
jgi:hypothetical protein